MKIDIGRLLHTITTENRKYENEIKMYEYSIDSQITNYDNSYDKPLRDGCVSRSLAISIIGFNRRKILRLQEHITLNKRIYDRIFMRRWYNILKKMN